MTAHLFADDILFYQRLLKAQGLYQGELDGQWGPKCEAAQAELETQAAALVASHGAFDTRSETNLRTLLLRAQAAARLCLQALANDALGKGITARILSGTRTYAEQNALQKQGRDGNPGKVVTNARGGESNHNFGIAWDVGLFNQGKYLDDSPLYATAGPIVLAAAPGVEWGGNWKSIVDRPHYQLVTNLSISAVRARFEAGQSYVPA
jgi:peptidoglycan L-alanyl-D-glutamate endopeptidase CwlK